MPYTKSVARKEFEVCIADLKSSSKKVSLKKNCIDMDIKQAVYRAAVFQASASLEEYVKGSLSDWIYMLGMEGKTLEHAPDELVSWAAICTQKGAFEGFFVSRDEKKIIRKIKGMRQLSQFFDRGELCKNVVNSTQYITDKKYPSEKNIHQLYYRFGINNMFKCLAVKGRKDYKRLLASFSDRRTEIAHTTANTTLTYLDIKKGLSDLLDIVDKMDRVLYSHVCIVSGATCWRVRM